MFDDDEAMYERTLKIWRRRSRRKYDPSSPLISVYRLEWRDNPHKGAWWSPPSFFQPTGDELIFPAWKYATRHGLPDPNDMPNIMKDGDEMAKHWTREYYSAFLDMAQVDQWLPVPEMRALVYDVPETCVREYHINKDRVLFGKHQVGFMLDFATPVRHLPREEFVRA